MMVKPKEEIKIKDIRCGSEPNNIVIIARQNTSIVKIDTVIWWNMEKDLEEESFEMNVDYMVLWGSAGNPYIVTKKKVYFIK